MRAGPKNKWEIAKDIVEEVVRHVPEIIDAWHQHHDDANGDQVENDHDSGSGDNDYGDDPD